MTAPLVYVGSDGVTDRLKGIEIWRKATEGVGRYELLLDNKDGALLDTFSIHDVVSIYLDETELGAALFFKGYLERITPKLADDPQNVLEETLLLEGRDLGQDLLFKFYDGAFHDKADNIIAALLSAAGSDVSFFSPGGAPQIYFDSKAAYLMDSVREILERIDYDGYVNTSKQFEMWPVGARFSAITLQALKNDPANNILKLVEYTKEDAYDRKDYIVGIGSDVNDGWTEGNADGWLPAYAGNTISDYFYNPPAVPIPAAGIAAIKVLKGTGEFTGAKLTFPRYNHSSIDYSNTSSVDISVAVYFAKSGPEQTVIQPMIYIKDTEGNVLAFFPSGALTTNWWTWITAPCGKSVVIPEVAESDKWYYVTKVTKFNWNIVELRVERSVFDELAIDYMLIDALRLPTEVLIAVADGTSESRVQKWPWTRSDIGTQKELQECVDSTLPKTKDPISRLTLIAKGSAGLNAAYGWRWIPGYYATVNIPALRISDDPWRFMELHHTIGDDAQDAYGFDHVVELQLVPAYAKLSTQRWAYGNPSSQRVAMFRALRDRLKKVEANTEELRDWYSALP